MISFDLTIDADDWQSLPDVQRLVEQALAAGNSVAEASGEVSLLLTSDAEMQRLNRQFRDKDKPTDVLSFPADPMDKPFLGDIAIGYETSAADAKTSGKSLPNHLTHLLIHGYLHLLGFDHMTETDAEEMEALERRALASLGIADPYSSA